jgi:hypothetical protein
MEAAPAQVILHHQRPASRRALQTSSKQDGRALSLEGTFQTGPAGMTGDPLRPLEHEQDIPAR